MGAGHQYFRIQENGAENVPDMPFPFAGVIYFGYNHTAKRYVAHELTVWGSDDPTEGFSSAYRTGNEILPSEGLYRHLGPPRFLLRRKSDPPRS